MTVQYRIFSGDHSGGPIDYTSAIATVTTLSWIGPALPLGSRTKFAVRAYDTVLALDDGNTDAVVTIAIDAAGSDATNAPQAPAAAAAVPVTGGNVRVSWSYPYADRATAPQGFHVYQGPDPGSINFTTPVATLSYGYGSILTPPPGPRTTRPEVTVTGLTNGTSYQWAVAGYNASGEGPSTICRATSRSTAPTNPTNLTVTATASG